MENPNIDMNNRHEKYIQMCNATEEFKGQDPTLDNIIEKLRELPKHTREKTSDLQILSNLRIAISQSCCQSYLGKLSISELFLVGYMKLKGYEWYDNQGKWAK